MDAVANLAVQGIVDEPMTLEAGLACEGIGYDENAKMTFAGSGG